LIFFAKHNSLWIDLALAQNFTANDSCYCEYFYFCTSLAAACEMSVESCVAGGGGGGGVTHVGVSQPEEKKKKKLIYEPRKIRAALWWMMGGEQPNGRGSSVAVDDRSGTNTM
jgi:hypothetical protein